MVKRFVGMAPSLLRQRSSHGGQSHAPASREADGKMLVTALSAAPRVGSRSAPLGAAQRCLSVGRGSHQQQESTDFLHLQYTQPPLSRTQNSRIFPCTTGNPCVP